MNRTIIVIGVVILLLAGAGSVWYWGFYQPGQVAKEQARMAQLAKEKAEKKRQEEAAQKKDRYDQLISEADAAFDQEQWRSAQALYTEAVSLFPNQSYPQDRLIVVNEKVAEIAEREARKEAGVIEVVSSPTGRFYVIVSSSIDEDLAMDYARSLSLEGQDTKLVQHHFSDLPFHGVSVADYDSWSQAEASLPEFSTFGEGLWILKY